jgi:hypothetical protein
MIPMRWPWFAVPVVACALAVSACGGHPPLPKRGVVEGDLGAWKFRRFQEVLDVEVWVEGNRAEAYSASYITADAEKRGHIDDKDLVNVFVTRYQAPDGVVRATVKLARRLAADGGYQVEEDKVAGARVLSIVGHGEAWMMWPADKHVVKVGGRGRTDVPKAMIASYVDRYPSQLPGGALEGTLPPGPDDAPRPVAKPAYDANNPQPDAEHYDPGKVKLPGAGSGSDDAATPGTGSDDAPQPAPPPAKKKKKKPASPTP